MSKFHRHLDRLVVIRYSCETFGFRLKFIIYLWKFRFSEKSVDAVPTGPSIGIRGPELASGELHLGTLWWLFYVLECRRRLFLWVVGWISRCVMCGWCKLSHFLIPRIFSSCVNGLYVVEVLCEIIILLSNFRFCIWMSFNVFIII